MRQPCHLVRIAPVMLVFLWAAGCGMMRRARKPQPPPPVGVALESPRDVASPEGLAVLKGRVEDLHDILQSGTVELWQAGKVLQTASIKNSEYQLPLPPGRYEVRLLGVGIPENKRAILVHAGEVVEVNFSLFVVEAPAGSAPDQTASGGIGWTGAFPHADPAPGVIAAPPAEAGKALKNPLVQEDELELVAPVPQNVTRPTPPPPKMDCARAGPPPAKTPLLFEPGVAELTAEMQGVLRNVVAHLLCHPEIMQVRIGGHTDSMEVKDAQQKSLSQKRAEAVRGELIKLGIPGARLKTTGFGATQPIYPNAIAKMRQKNRRVEIIF